MIRRGSETILFDCGEGSQQQMMRASGNTNFRVKAIFITHWHADHFLGILGLLQTLSFYGRTEDLIIYGPLGIHEYVEYIRILSGKLRFLIRGREMSDGRTENFSGYSVTAFKTHHRIIGIGYTLIEEKRPGKFDREAAIALGVPIGPLFSCLQAGEPVNVKHEDEEITIFPQQVMGEMRTGRKIVYTGDTRPMYNSAPESLTGADLLIHDATYIDKDKVRAEEFFHSTASEAGKVGRFLKAKRLALVHISSRYTQTADHVREAESEYEGEILAPYDLDYLEIPYS